MKPGEIWAPPMGEVAIVLRPQGTNRFLLANLTVPPGEQPMTGEQLRERLAGYTKVGFIGKDE